MLRSKILALVCLMALPACEPVATPVNRPDAPATTRTAETGGARTLLNNLRARRGLGRVIQSPRLTSAAAGHARDMSARAFFSHKGSDGSSVGRRVERKGYGYCLVNENLSYGRRNLDTVILAWMDSPGHRRNMLNPNVTEFGIARAAGDYWVLVMARPGC